LAANKRIPDRLIQTGDRLKQDAQSLARESAGVLNDCPFLRGRMVSVLFTAGVPTVVNHKIGTVARCFPASFLYGPLQEPADPINLDAMWVERGWQGSPLAGFTLRAGSFTVGCRFSTSKAKAIGGVRFIWADAARTIRASLWRDSTGVRLASSDIAVSDDGVYVAMFRTPVDVSQMVNENLTVSIWDISGTNYVASGVDTIGGVGPYVFPNDTTMQAKRLFSAGNARPTSTAATEDYWVEPVYVTKGISVLEDPDQSGIDTQNQVRLIGDSNGYADLWFYPKASQTVPTGKTQSP
jgi:hypothetical protein